MSDPNQGRTAGTAGGELTEEISRSVGSIWQRHAGARPSTVSTEIEGDVVTCVIEASVEIAPAETENEGDGTEEAEEVVVIDGQKLLSTGAYRADAIVSISRATHRKVMGFVCTRDADAGTSTQRFILERPTPKR